MPTIPKRLRIYFRFDRSLLGDLCRAAARTVITVYRAASGRPDAVPGMVGAIQTFGQLAHFHPHIHALVSQGVFLPETGAFLPLPKLATEPFLKLWEQEVFALLLREGKITQEVVQNIRSWKHSGFSVDQSVRLEAGDQAGIQRLIQYFLRCPFSQARMIEVLGQAAGRRQKPLRMVPGVKDLQPTVSSLQSPAWHGTAGCGKKVRPEDHHRRKSRRWVKGASRSMKWGARSGQHDT